MKLLEQCRIWHENDEYQKIIDAIEALPEGERSPETDSELARAYNNLAQPGQTELFERALALLKPHEEYFADDHNWNFRVGYAYYYLDMEDLALHYFERALALRPGDADTQAMIEDCRRLLALPRFTKNFRVRTEEVWEAFAAREDELRRQLREQDGPGGAEALLETCRALFAPALPEVVLELGAREELCELVLSPEGNRARLFPLVYFAGQAPAAVREHWKITVGRPPVPGLALRAGGQEVTAEDVRVWVEQAGERQVDLTLFCEGLQPLIKEREEQAWMLLSLLIDQTLGEVNAIAFVRGLAVAREPMEEPDVRLSDLPEELRRLGLSLYDSAEAYVENGWLSYELEPEQDPRADWRLDVCVGSTRLPVLINEYLNGETSVVDEYYRQGAAAGFLCYPAAGFSGENRGKELLEFRDALQAAVQEKAGAAAVTFLGGASGLHCGYLDFIAWDLGAVLDAATDFLTAAGLPWAAFHSFRRNVGGVRLFGEQEETAEPAVDPETGSLLAKSDIEALEAMEGDVGGYFGQMFDYITGFVERGVAEGRFTERQARCDLQVALWYAYACLNIDRYEFYYRAARWLPDSEENAAGCGTWYYRYSTALMYCGRLQEAFRYAEAGTEQEPDYPWIWLQAGKLRAYFGDQAGALAAVERGLALVPGDHEFLSLREEILAGASLEQMEYHWIHPEADRLLQEGLEEQVDDKLRAISCITLDEEGLAAFRRIIRPEQADYAENGPYCRFVCTVLGQELELVFCMNAAGLSKLKADWLRTQWERLEDGHLLQQSGPQEREGTLETVVIGLDYSVGLFYRCSGEKEEWFRLEMDEEGRAVVPDAPEGFGGAASEQYTEEEMAAVQAHIETYFGPVDQIYHELVSPDIHVDICLVQPAQEGDPVTLVTMGMGAHRMSVPEELADEQLERAELAIVLPPEWKLDMESFEDERWYWPLRLLKTLARLPIECDTWLGWGHTVDHEEPFAANTQLSGAILISPQQAEADSERCLLPGGETVNFYQVMPVYADEIEYKQEHGAVALLDLLAEIGFLADPYRPDVIPTEEEGKIR